MSMMIRVAQEEDASAITALNNHYAEQNITLPRTEDNVRKTLADWVVAVEFPRSPDGEELHEAGKEVIVGCGSLVALTDELAEVRSLAIAEGQQGKGYGAMIVRELVTLARSRQYKQVCALTLTEGFFLKLGFHLVDRWSISPKVWQACIYCPKFHRCDEVAVLMDLYPSATIDEPRVDYKVESVVMPQPIPSRQPAWTKLLKWQSWQPLKLAYMDGQEKSAVPVEKRQEMAEHESEQNFSGKE